MTPLGHLLFGYLFFLVLSKIYSRLSLSEFLFGALLPDIDALLLITGGYFLYHGMFTHSVFFLLFVAIIFGIRFSSVSIFAGGMLHLVIDMVLADTNPLNGLGMRLLWPLSGVQFYLGWFDLSFFPSGYWVHLIQNAAYEIILFMAILILYLVTYRLLTKRSFLSGFHAFLGPLKKTIKSFKN
ncbi:hypothetical protein COV93_06595 [Candidatus Woesearchaeota archaeon CG11_big_fil_rev_8_21_14_0_20_43_8]|nr:MAG: hypothetical protein COV93_06595 [Candidatus Woesearchaeota archaeon CG11_big_fil_rev_8_21_14_0_20_43_8]